MLSREVASLLGLATAARKTSTGDVLINDIRQKKVFLVLIANDASENTLKKISDKCKYYHCDYEVIGSSDQISKAIGKSNRMAVGILDKGFADKMKSKLGG